MNKNLRVLMVGAGAIGGNTAAFMALAGYDVTIVANREEVAEQIRTKGIKISGVLGNHEVVMKAVAKVPELKGLFDVVFIATKAYDMPKVARKLLTFIHEKSLVVSMQNGICTDDLAAIVGPKRTVGCVIGFGATMLERGSLLITSHGEFIIGSIDKENKPNLSIVQEMLNKVFPTIISDNIFEELYSKLIINSCITSLGAICGLKLGEMLKIKKARAIFIGIIKEAMNVAKGLNINVPPYAGKLNYYKLIDDKTTWSRFKANLVISVVGHKYRHLKSSSLQSLERGQLTEIDYFNGYIVKKADEIGIDAPINRQLVAMIKKIEAKQLTIQLTNLDEVQL
ncbi:MAG: ketopantoate reductase family protein [Bacilli bacterium]